MSVVATQCTNMKFTSTSCNAREMEKIHNVKSDLSIRHVFFQLTVTSIEIQ